MSEFTLRLPSMLMFSGLLLIVDCKNFDHIKVMFYTGYNAHGFLPYAAVYPFSLVLVIIASEIMAVL